MFLLACSPRADPPGFHELGRQGVLRFVYLNPDRVEGQAWVEGVGRKICGGEGICHVHFWLEVQLVPRGLPMTDEQVNSTFAVYAKNTGTGLDELRCHPFGGAATRCAGAG